MITKRLMALIALASSAALAQQQPGDGNVPAPNLFDSQVVCTSRLPSMVPTPGVAAEGATASDLDTAIGMGTARISGTDLLNDLGYVVPALGGNCGQGEGETAFMAAVEGAVATDVAEGYSALLPKFTAVYGDPGDLASTGTTGALEQARAALQRAEADDSTSATRLRQLREALEDARESHTGARAEYDALALGPIYEAGVAEWMAKAAVTQSISDYNDAVREAISAQDTLDDMRYDDYVPLGNADLVNRVVFVVGDTGIIDLSRLRDYTNANLNNTQVATVDANGVTNTINSNFDAAGNLIVPMHLSGTELRSTTQRTAVDAARENRDEYKVAAAALRELQEENQNLLLQPIIDEAVRRARAEADYYEQQYQTLLADTTNQNPITFDNAGTPENEAAPYSIASRYAEYLTASNARVTAEADLRARVKAREAATQHVIDQFQNPASFYSQLVARRQVLKDQIDQEVEDETEPSLALTNAAAAAADAVTAAEEALAAYQAVADDPDDPVIDLIDTLLETDGDDGQAVVDAISETYDRTVANRDSIEALTADTDDGAEADGPITANAKAIESNAEKIQTNADGVKSNDEEIERLGGRVTQNEEDIGTLREQTDTNTGMIAANAGNISMNASNITVNASNIVDNRGLISRNSATLVNQGALIDRNAGHIALNSERIGANAASIGMNSGLISDNRHMIGELSSNLDIVRAGVAASIALSRMPSVDGGGISFGAGTFAGEMAYAVGFQVERGFGTFDIGVTSSGGEIGAGVGVGLKVWH